MDERLLKKHDVMISYSTKTKEIGDDVRQILIDMGYDVWMAPESIPAGECYDNEIYAAIENSELVLFLLSEPSLTSRWCKSELKYATNINKRVLPVQIEGVDNPYEKLGKISCILGKRQIFDMFPEYEKKLNLIADKVSNLLSTEESVLHPYPVISAEMQDVDSVCIGRERETYDIYELLNTNDFINVYGFGGIGKTRVIKKFFSDYFLSAPYLTIHVAKYTQSLMFTIAHVPFVGFNDEKYLSELRDDTITKEQALYKKKKELLCTLSNTCLLIIDGMDYVDISEIEELKKINCHKIIVSRNRYDGVPFYEICEMAEDDLVKFFDGVEAFDEQKDIICQIIKTVGKHTLTISLIAAYCREFCFSPQEILDDGVLYDLQKYETDDKKISNLLDKIKLTEREEYCLKILALFPNGISKGKLQKTDREVVKIAQDLVKKSLVIGSSSTFQLHQIVRELVCAKYQMSANSIEPFLSNFLLAMRKLDIEENELYFVLRHMESVLFGDGDLIIKLYHEIGTWVCDYAYMSLFHVNRELYKKTNVCGQDLNNTKMLHFDRFLFAEKMQLKAFALAEKSQSDYVRATITNIASMVGAANYNMNNFAKAFSWQQKALEYAEKYLTEEDKYLHWVLSRLGLTAIRVDEWDVGLNCFLRLLKIGQADNFKTSSKSSILYRLGLLYKHKKQYNIATQYFEEALKEQDNSPLAQSDLHLLLAEIALHSGDVERAKNQYLVGKNLRLALFETEEAAQDFINANDKIYLN